MFQTVLLFVIVSNLAIVAILLLLSTVIQYGVKVVFCIICTFIRIYKVTVTSSLIKYNVNNVKTIVHVIKCN